MVTVLNRIVVDDSTMSEEMKYHNLFSEYVHLYNSSIVSYCSWLSYHMRPLSEVDYNQIARDMSMTVGSSDVDGMNEEHPLLK